jgi:small subunit ribosomal protein S17
VPRRILQGKVISAKRDKTITVQVERLVMHKLYRKFIRRSKKYSVHDTNNISRDGDIVNIRECSPISKTKSWELLPN